MIIYLWRYHPYDLLRFTRLEIFNESTVFLATYPLLAFTEWVWRSDR